MTEFGVQIPWFGFSGSPGATKDALARIARRAEEAGLSSLWIADHLYQSPYFGDVSGEMLECYTTLGYLAGVTSSISLGAMVSSVTLRNPVMLIKQATTLDVLSQGRSWLGLGLGWYEREHLSTGIQFPSRRDRAAMLEDTVVLAKQMWGSDDGAFAGRCYRVRETICSPKPIRHPHPPILIGGSGRDVVATAAAHADALNIHGDPARVRLMVERLARACEAAGRDPSEVACTWLGSPHGRDLARQVSELVRAGVAGVIYNIPPLKDVSTIEAFIEWMGVRIPEAVDASTV